MKQADKTAAAPSRRDFLAGAGAGLLVPFTLGATTGAAVAGTGSKVNAYVQIANDAASTVTIYVGPSEMGQGIMTGVAQAVAEELMLDPLTWTTQVRVEHGDAFLPPVTAAAAAPYPQYNPDGSPKAPFAKPSYDWTLLSENPAKSYLSQSTGGSNSMMNWFMPARQAAANAREMLIAAGADYLNEPLASPPAKNGRVWGASGASVPYGAIATAAAAKTLAGKGQLVTTFRIIGQSVPRTDIPAKMDGSAIFGIDVRLPGMVYAAVNHSPILGGSFTTLPAKPSGSLGVVKLVNDAGVANAVAVVASNTWSAMKMADALKITWTAPTAADLALVNSADITAAGQALLTGAPVTLQKIVETGTPDAALSTALVSIDQVYTLPFLAHATMEVMNCTARVTPATATAPAQCEIWAPTQSASACVATAQRLLGATAQVTVHTTYLGGGLGRKIEQDYIAQAIQVAQTLTVPVKLTWTRAQDFKNDRYRPCAQIRVQAGLEASGALTMVYRTVAPSKSGANPDKGSVAGASSIVYNAPNKRIEFVPNPVKVPLGFWRSVGESYNTFAVECAIDELAVAAGKDPAAFRLDLLTGDTRATAVVKAVLADCAAAPLPAGSARGMAFLKGFGSYIAIVAEIALDAAGAIVVKKIYTAVDCGTAINPGNLEAQIQGGVVHGLSATLWGQVTFNKGAPSVSAFSGYRMVKLKDMPIISVNIVNTPGAPIGGVGELGVPCVAPAIANAYARLTGARSRSLPCYPGAVMGGL